MLGEEISVFGNWFLLHFIENDGMAFGMQFGGQYGKLILVLFRIIAISLLSWYLYGLVKKKAHKLLIYSLSLIIAGAIGNLIDSIFYGVLYSDSIFKIAQFMPKEGGYAGLFYGAVVDMFYFPILQGHYPDWFPFFKNEEFIFFRPVFNIADTSITIGVSLILVFHNKLFPKQIKQENKSSNELNV